MIFAEWAILLLGSLKVRALCAIYLASQINAERRLWITKAEQMKRNITHHFFAFHEHVLRTNLGQKLRRRLVETDL